MLNGASPSVCLPKLQRHSLKGTVHFNRFTPPSCRHRGSVFSSATCLNTETPALTVENVKKLKLFVLSDGGWAVLSSALCQHDAEQQSHVPDRRVQLKDRSTNVCRSKVWRCLQSSFIQWLLGNVTFKMNSLSYKITAIIKKLVTLSTERSHNI